ncbi:hypothetical protein CC80DRAFT_508435 [Byssothecium circinans]|uniref:Uncharacterized protein n=1 Tax=Byssothecium circinans TaxID=147558 RepID=A0A6A5TI96_9PLEO|nr:hypothetical protein CC80DRAFT_508435 [Byssothecium circinans]
MNTLPSVRPTAVPSPETDNATAVMSPLAVDALQLAQFIKNLGVSVFNASELNATMSRGGSGNETSLTRLVTGISMALQDLLSRSRGEDVPPYQYTLPDNGTELVLLMGALKSVELGVLMSLAEALPPTDTSATILLSSIASVAARQNALLHSYGNAGASTESFETPASGVWAYNFALEYTQPGSCALELPLAILPRFTMNSKPAGYARPGTNVTFGWDAAGMRLVDPPSFTPLMPLGDGLGTTSVPLGLSGTAFAVLTAQPGLTGINELTEATLAGPVVLRLTP